MSVTWIQHKEKDILYVNYEGISDELQLSVILKKAVQAECTSYNILQIVNFTDTKPHLSFIDEIYRSIKHHRKNRVARCAILGMNRGVKRRLLDTYIKTTGDSSIYRSDSFENALDELVHWHSQNMS